MTLINDLILVTFTVTLIFTIGYVAGDKANDCMKDILFIYKAKTTRKGLLRHGLLVLDKAFIESQNKPYALKYFVYLFENSNTNALTPIPIMHCRKHIHSDPILYQKCKDTLSEAGFNANEEAFNTFTTPKGDTPELQLIDHLNMIFAEKDKAYKYAYYNMNKSKYQNNKILKDFMEIMSTTIEIKKRSNALHFEKFCYREAEIPQEEVLEIVKT